MKAADKSSKNASVPMLEHNDGVADGPSTVAIQVGIAHEQLLDDHHVGSGHDRQRKDWPSRHLAGWFIKPPLLP
jgi:hypothetical protein